MGGMINEVRGSSKIETFQCHNPDPKYKKLCKSLMKQDPDTGEWVLVSRLHT